MTEFAVSEPTKCYAVTSGEYSAYEVHAIYRRREDAEARVERSRLAWDRIKDHSDRLGEFDDDARVEEFDYFEGEAPGGLSPPDR